MKKISIFLGILLSSNVFADCMFKIINYTDSQVTTKIGFYHGQNKTIIAEPATTTIESIPSNYQCNGVTPVGLGVSYVSFTKDPGHGGMNYSPSSKSAMLTGTYAGSSYGRIIQADNGSKLWIDINDNAIRDDVFEIKLNFTGRPNSRSAGTP